MRRLGLLLVCSLCICAPLRSQTNHDKIACYADQPHNDAFKKNLWDGYEISLGPVAHPEDVDFKCTAAIYSSGGRVVFRTNGFNVVFDEDLTGEDFNGDGKPEVVFRTDTGGGMHCCWGYVIVSLSPKPHKLFDVSMDGKVDFEKDKDGKMVIWQRQGGPMEFTSMAGRPFAAKVSRVRDSKLVDVTSGYCGSKDQRIERHELGPEDLKKLEMAGASGSEEVEDVVSAAESAALQHVFCREYDAAVKDLQLWPADKREEVVKAFSESLAKEYPEFEEKLRKTFPRK